MQTAPRPQGSAGRAAPILIAIYSACIVGGGILGYWVLGFVAPLDDDWRVGGAVGALLGALSGLLAAAGVHGGRVMSGSWWGAGPGLGIGVAMFGIVASAEGAGDGLLILGIAGLVVALVGFYIIGILTGSVPGYLLEGFGSFGSVISGVILLVVGLSLHLTMVLVLGVSFVVVGATILAARRYAAVHVRNDAATRRRPPPPPPRRGRRPKKARTRRR